MKREMCIFTPEILRAFNMPTNIVNFWIRYFARERENSVCCASQTYLTMKTSFCLAVWFSKVSHCQLGTSCFIKWLMMSSAIDSICEMPQQMGFPSEEKYSWKCVCVAYKPRLGNQSGKLFLYIDGIFWISSEALYSVLVRPWMCITSFNQKRATPPWSWCSPIWFLSLPVSQSFNFCWLSPLSSSPAAPSVCARCGQ